MSDIKSNFKNNLIYYLNLRQKTQSDLAKSIGVAKTTISSYVNGVSTPRLDKIDKICDFLNISRNDLLENHNDSSNDEEILNLARYIFELTDEDKNFIINTIKHFRGE
ncbi:helix-turn-helix domain-containing protein [Ezakiella coagulans]|uniref:helix-turn-helix domain-containing protein n=1 Tax=Ezakiella coagulans TaxID=46507 RepID=UPI00288BC98B|nr:helix-turn-helix transcriptional regulator [Ezakiella coagulans]